MNSSCAYRKFEGNALYEATGQQLQVSNISVRGQNWKPEGFFQLSQNFAIRY